MAGGYLAVHWRRGNAPIDHPKLWAAAGAPENMIQCILKARLCHTFGVPEKHVKGKPVPQCTFPVKGLCAVATSPVLSGIVTATV